MNDHTNKMCFTCINRLHHLLSIQYVLRTMFFLWLLSNNSHLVYRRFVVTNLSSTFFSQGFFSKRESAWSGFKRVFELNYNRTHHRFEGVLSAVISIISVLNLDTQERFSSKEKHKPQMNHKTHFLLTLLLTPEVLTIRRTSPSWS